MTDHNPQDLQQIASMAQDPDTQSLARQLFLRSCRYRYSYNFSWLGRPVIQYPEDLIVMQEIIATVRPDLIIETGVAHGGSIIFYASMLELLGQSGGVVGVDVEIRPHNREAIEKHPMSKRITLIEGSSVDPGVARQVRQTARSAHCVMVVLDSNHTHEHVLRELHLYAPLVTQGSYLVVFDTVVEDMPADFFPDRPWGPGNNPKTAVRAFLNATDRFVVDQQIQQKLLMTVAPEGYLKCVKD